MISVFVQVMVLDKKLLDRKGPQRHMWNLFVIKEKSELLSISHQLKHRRHLESIAFKEHSESKRAIGLCQTVPV